MQDMSGKEAIDMMNRCKGEIVGLRQQVAILAPKADAYDKLSIVLDLLPKRASGMAEDVVWTLDKRIRELSAEPANGSSGGG